ncbi:uncharacterized protein G2W53_033684 [Senna tora]|uniref:Uncharacterized protein n=1 Tax=Senna tora TaxID=362788 RepID=A0A834SXZ0_9FABA|nr:uncharacterized protein G2W53_033684 [Senna tora]
MGGAGIMSQHIPDDKSRFDLRNLHELRGKTLVAQVSQTRRFALYSRTGVVLMLQLESSWHGRSVDLRNFHELRSKRLVAQERQTRQFTLCLRTGADDKSRSDIRNLHQLRGKRLVAQVSQTRRFANRSGFDALIGVVLAWEERGSCLNIFRTKNRGRISETFTNYEAKDLLRNMGGAWIMSQHIPDDKSRSDLRNLHELRGKRLVAQVEHGSCLNILGTINRGWISETFTNYEAKDLLSKSVDHVSTYSGRQITVGSQKKSRITRQKTCYASESNTSVRVVLANQSGFDAPIGVFLAWEEHGSCLNIFWTTNHGRISETLTNYEAKGLLRKSVDHVSTYSGRKITVGSQKPSRIMRQKTCCASESNTSVRVVFANRSGFDAPIGVIMAWEERGSCLKIFRKTNRGAWIMSQHIPDDKSRSDLRNLHELRGKRLVAQVSQTRRFALYSRTGVVLDAPIGVVLACEERKSCLNIFRTTNRDRISETFTNYEAKD